MENELLLEGLRDVLYNNTVAEKTCKRVLRKGQRVLNNRNRASIARRLFGVSCLRVRLEYIAESLSGHWNYSTETIDQHLVYLVTLYVVLEEAKYFSFVTVETQQTWLDYALTCLPSQALEDITNTEITWPSDPTTYIAVVFSFPVWLVELFLNNLSFNQACSLAESLNRPGGPILRCNSFKADPVLLIEQLASEGTIAEVSMLSTNALRIIHPPKPNIRGSSLFQAGYFEVQDEGSQLISLAAGISPGMSVLDLCCGRGGKAMHLATLLGSSNVPSRLVCHDVDIKALDCARTRLSRPGVIGSNVDLYFACSSSQFVVGGRGGDMSSSITKCEIAGIDSGRLLAALDGLADVVLVDAPCSSLGTLRRGPNVRWEMSEDNLKVFPSLQRSILTSAVDFVKPGGSLVYATCTFNTQECEDVKTWFDETFSNFSQASLAEAWGPELSYKLNLETKASCVQLYPHLHNTDAFFIARWTRTV